MKYGVSYLRRIAGMQSTSLSVASYNWRLEYIKNLFLISVLSIILAVLIFFVYLGMNHRNFPDDPGTRRVETNGRAYVMIQDDVDLN